MAFFQNKKPSGDTNINTSKRKTVRSQYRQLSLIDEHYSGMFLKISPFKNVHSEVSKAGLRLRAQLFSFSFILVIALSLGLGLGLRHNNSNVSPSPPFSPIPGHNAKAAFLARQFANTIQTQQNQYITNGNHNNLILVFQSDHFTKVTKTHTPSQVPMPAYVRIHNLKFNNSIINQTNTNDFNNFNTDLEFNDFTGGTTYETPIAINLKGATSKNPLAGVSFISPRSQNPKEIQLYKNGFDQSGAPIMNRWTSGEDVNSKIKFSQSFSVSTEYTDYLKHFPQLTDKNGKLDEFSSGPMTQFVFSRAFVSGHLDNNNSHSTSDTAPINFRNQVFKYKNFDFSAIKEPRIPNTAAKSNVVSLISASDMFRLQQVIKKNVNLQNSLYRDSTLVYKNFDVGSPSMYVENPVCNWKPLFKNGETKQLYYYNLLLNQPYYENTRSVIDNSYFPNDQVNHLSFTQGEKTQFSADAIASQYIGMAPKQYYNLAGLRDLGYVADTIQHNGPMSEFGATYNYSAVLAPFVLRLNYLWIPQNGQWNSPTTKWALAIVYNYQQSTNKYQITSNFTSTLEPTQKNLNCSSPTNVLATWLTGYDRIDHNGRPLSYPEYQNLHFANDIDPNLNITDGNQSNLNLGELQSDPIYWTKSY